MDSKCLCAMGTYLSFVLAITLIGVLIPWLGGATIILGWAISATYLHLMPLKTWLKSRAIVEAIKLPSLYTNTVELYGTLEAIKGAGVALVAKLYFSFLPKLTGKESEIITQSISEIVVLPLHELALSLPFITIGVTYLGIGVIYIYLKHIGFYRRILT